MKKIFFILALVLLIGCSQSKVLSEVQDTLDLRCKGYLEQNPDFILLTIDDANVEAYSYTRDAITSSIRDFETSECSMVASDLVLSDNKLFADVFVTTTLKYKMIETGEQEIFSDSSRVTFQKTTTGWKSLWETN